MSVIDRVIEENPPFHANGERAWSALPGTLRLIESVVMPGMTTIETGAGCSTVAFTAAGGRHIAISPAADEHQRIQAYCVDRGLDTGRLTFVAEPSERVLPRLWADGLRVDVAFIDGRHSFPGPAVDFAYLSRMLKVGGTLILDDAPIPAVAVVHRHLVSSPEWSSGGCADHRAVAFVKLAEEPAADDWRAQPYNANFPEFRLLAPPPRRWLLRWGIRARAGRSRLGARYPILRSLRRRLAR